MGAVLNCLAAWLLIFFVTFSSVSVALSNDARVPVLLYHSSQVMTPCDYGNNAQLALAGDLEILYQHGFTVVPVYWIVEWSRGIRDGSTLPDKVVGITFDDGVDSDWIDNAILGHPCSPIPSFRTRLQEFKSGHLDLPSYSPHASSFVIASPTARLLIDDASFPPPYGTAGINNFIQDYWWPEAAQSGLIEIYNHSVDHDHDAILAQTYDQDLDIYLAVGGYADGVWNGTANFYRINDFATSTIQVVDAASYIGQFVAYPDLFAYPYGQASSYIQNDYFPNFFSTHGTVAAFCTEQDTPISTYVSRGSPYYCMGRFTYGLSWTTPGEFIANVLQGARAR